MASFCFNNVFMWQNDKVFVMDNHMAALWGWLQVCDPQKKYNFMHIDRHYDMLECFKDEDLEPVKKNPNLAFEEFHNLKRKDGEFQAFRWDNYIMEFVLMSGNFGHNRDHSYFEKYPYLVRKCVSFGRRVGDLARHTRIFPIDSLRFFPSMLVNGVRSAVRGEG